MLKSPSSDGLALGKPTDRTNKLITDRTNKVELINQVVSFCKSCQPPVAWMLTVKPVYKL